MIVVKMELIQHKKGNKWERKRESGKHEERRI
jgi:hypothetical protein